MFRAKIRKNVYPCKAQVHFIVRGSTIHDPVSMMSLSIPGCMSGVVISSSARDVLSIIVGLGVVPGISLAAEKYFEIIMILVVKTILQYVSLPM